MKRFILSSFIYIFAGSFSLAQESVEVRLDSVEYQYIQRALSEILLTKNLFSENICKILNQKDLISYTTGAKAITAAVFVANCNAETPQYRGKIFQKKYFKYTKQHHLYGSFLGWTNQMNETFLREDVLNNRELIRDVVLHELAIGFDAKTGVFLQRAHAQQPEFFNIKSNDDRNNLNLAFKKSQYLPISNTFAALRSFYLESEYFRNMILTNPQSCKNEFLQIYNQISHIKSSSASPSKVNDLNQILYTTITNSISNSNHNHDEIEDLEFVLDYHLKTNDSLSFCQFMAIPFLSNKTFHTFSASGPRPNVGGGWGTSNKLGSQNDYLNHIEPLNTSSNIKSNFKLTEKSEIEKIKKDPELLKQYKIRIEENGQRGLIETASPLKVSN